MNAVVAGAREADSFRDLVEGELDLLPLPRSEDRRTCQRRWFWNMWRETKVSR